MPAKAAFKGKTMYHLAVYVEPKTARRVKVEAARQGIPMYRFIGNAIEKALDAESKANKAPATV